MKRVIVTGASGFIGGYLIQHLPNVTLQPLSLRDASWVNQRLDADVIIHCAGLAHATSSIQNSDYEEVNARLTVSLALKAKEEGVQQFIFLSTQLVYGTGHVGVIATDQPLRPASAYAKSKLQAEEGLKALVDTSFHVCIYRLPLVYGNQPKGNLAALLKGSKFMLVFPKLDNQRSVISLPLLCDHLTSAMTQSLSGTFHIADETPLSTYRFVQAVRAASHKRTVLIRFFNPSLRWLRSRSTLFGKVWGDAVYDATIVLQNPEAFGNIYQWIQSLEAGGHHEP